MKAKELRAFRLVTGITAQEVVDAMKGEFPKIDKTIISKCESKAYGVELSSEAERVLLEKYYDRFSAVKDGSFRRRKERRKKTRRVSVRLAEEEFSRFQQHLKDAGVTAQDALTRLIEKEIATSASPPRNDTVMGKEIATAQAPRNDRVGSSCEFEGSCTGASGMPRATYPEEVGTLMILPKLSSGMPRAACPDEVPALVIHSPCGYRPPVRIEGGKDG